jgi:hypothetical protein
MIGRWAAKNQDGEIGRRQFLKAAGMAAIAAAAGTPGCTSLLSPVTPSATPRPTREPLQRSNRQAFHSSASLEACIADLAKALQPDLVIADAYRVLATAGPAAEGRTTSSRRPTRSSSATTWLP